MSLGDFISNSQLRFEKSVKVFVQSELCLAPKLQEAMIYALANGGKRIRPLLVYATGYALDVPAENLDAAACSIELIHTYSLIHDDLPAMDNADLRRGKPACHIAFGEAMAILAGDALQPLAFEILASHSSELSLKQRLTMIQTLCHASGFQGMAAGQALDMEGVTELATLKQMYTLKTGALIKTSVELALIAANAEHPLRTALLKFADILGLAFQMQDDLLDVLSSADMTGKTHALDDANQKTTFATLLGIEKTQATIQQLFSDAKQAIACLADKAALLYSLTDYILQRKK